MPRDPIGALIQLVLGLPLLGAGLVAAAWLATAAFEPGLGVDALTWAVAHSPVRFPFDPEPLALQAMQQDSMIAIGVAAFFLILIGWSFLAAAGANLRPAAPVEPLAQAEPVAPTIVAHPGSTVFAHKMLSDSPSRAPSHAPRAARPSPVALGTHAGPSLSPPHRFEGDLEGLARLIGTDGKFTPQQRDALAKLTPEQQAALAKFSKWAPSRKNAVIALIALFFAFQLLPSIFSFLLNL